MVLTLAMLRAISREYQTEATPTDMFATVHQSLREAGAFMPAAHINHDRSNVQNVYEVLDALQANPLTNTGQITYEIGLSQSATCHMTYTA
jgi:hypothetical protein